MEDPGWHPMTGLLMTHVPSTYKIPTAHDTPVHFEVALFEAPNPADTIRHSKAVGEPPLRSKRRSSLSTHSCRLRGHSQSTGGFR